MPRTKATKTIGNAPLRQKTERKKSRVKLRMNKRGGGRAKRR